VEEHARSLCGDLGFDACVKRPVLLTLHEDVENVAQSLLGPGPTVTR
jgi:hypothetical protein